MASRAPRGSRGSAVGSPPIRVFDTVAKIMWLTHLFRRKTFDHGVHPLEHKEVTAKLPIRRLAFAPELTIPLAQHIGAPAKPLVHKGQEVVRGQPIATAQGLVSVPMHAPAPPCPRRREAPAPGLGPSRRGVAVSVSASASVATAQPRRLLAGWIRWWLRRTRCGRPWRRCSGNRALAGPTSAAPPVKGLPSAWKKKRN